MLGDCSRHHDRPHPDIDGVNQDCLFILHQPPSEGYDDPFEVEPEHMCYIGKSIRLATNKDSFRYSLLMRATHVRETSHASMNVAMRCLSSPSWLESLEPLLDPLLSPEIAVAVDESLEAGMTIPRP